jgi:hypothetical protein
LQAAFDLLDKAEALMGYGIRGSGDVFKRLLRRTPMVARLSEAWDRLPVRLRVRFRAHTSALFDHVYEHVRDHAHSYRLTPRAVKVWRPASNRLVALPMDTFVPDLVRARLARSCAAGETGVVRAPGSSRLA